MTEVKFNPEVDAEVLSAMEDENTEVALAAPTTMALGQMAGDNTIADLKFPRLQIAYGVGGLAENFAPGDLVLDKEHLLAKKNSPIRLVILNTNTYWKEYTTFGSVAMPRVFKTRDEVHVAGFTTEWKDGQAPQFKRAMDLRLLIKKPDGLTCGLFGLKLGDSEWAPAMWSVDKTAFDKINDKLTPVANFALRDKGLLYGSWDLSTETEKKKNGNVVIVPVIKYAGLNSEDLVKDIHTTFGQG